MFICLLDSGIGTLLQSARGRLRSAHRPATQASHRSAMRMLLGWTYAHHIDIKYLSIIQLVAYLEFLFLNDLKPASIKTHIMSLKTPFYKYDLPVHVFDCKEVGFMLKSFDITSQYNPKICKVFSIEMLYNIINNMSVLKEPLLYRTIFLLAFFGFFRISNLVPRTSLQFDATRNLCRGDIIISHPGLQVILKWSKTLQARNSFKTIPIGTLSNSILCPVKAFMEFVQQYPCPPEHPMFFYYNNKGSKVIIGETHVRAALRQVLNRLDLDSSKLGFHTFRRSGATLAYQLGVPIQHIQSHGTWMSDAVWTYIKASPAHTPVTDAFISTLGFG